MRIPLSKDYMIRFYVLVLIFFSFAHNIVKLYIRENNTSNWPASEIGNELPVQ